LTSFIVPAGKFNNPEIIYNGKVLDRAWQNGRLWISDPDCLLLAGGKNIQDKLWIFHATIVHAVGGLVMDGDRAADLGEKELNILRKVFPQLVMGLFLKMITYTLVSPIQEINSIIIALIGEINLLK
jgi:hypothetical protein